jgi:long-chain acyl-CoA synthetase
VEHFWNALGFVLVQGYGMTETTALITLNHPFHVARGTIGKPLPGREVKIGPDGEVLVRGPMISTSTWQGGQLRHRTDEWLPTGDLAETQSTGELKFLGRKSEVIVTGAGVNIHPEDLEAVIEAHPAVAACAVVPIETPSGPEPCAVLAMRTADVRPAAVIEQANAQLAEFQRVRRWLRWPEPDLPRTSTGKVRRRAVAEWVASQQGNNGRAAAAHEDWLLHLITQITGENPPPGGDDLRLSEDLHLDSLGRVQLAAAIEQKLGMPPESGLLEEIQTLGELRAIAGGSPTPAHLPAPSISARQSQPTSTAAPAESGKTHQQPQEPSTYIYPRWPWTWPVRIIRSAFLECIMRPLVWLLAGPRVGGTRNVDANAAPMLIIANHVTAYDGPLVQYALPGRVRRAVAAAMSGEMLEDFRHARNPNRGPHHGRFYPFGPAAWFLVTALFNVFPLPRLRDFQRSFAHAGAALDRGFHVLVFPEGTRSAEGHLAAFRPGIGLLVRQSNVPVLPVAIRGLGELKAKGRGWFRSGKVEVRVGQPIRFSPSDSEADITERLHTEVARLLNG